MDHDDRALISWELLKGEPDPSSKLHPGLPISIQTWGEQGTTFHGGFSLFGTTEKGIGVFHDNPSITFYVGQFPKFTLRLSEEGKLELYKGNALDKADLLHTLLESWG